MPTGTVSMRSLRGTGMHNNEKWLNCEKRMQARDFMLESGSKSTAQTTPYNVLSTTEKMAKL